MRCSPPALCCARRGAAVRARASRGMWGIGAHGGEARRPRRRAPRSDRLRPLRHQKRPSSFSLSLSLYKSPMRNTTRGERAPTVAPPSPPRGKARRAPEFFLHNRPATRRGGDGSAASTGIASAVGANPSARIELKAPFSSARGRIRPCRESERLDTLREAATRPNSCLCRAAGGVTGMGTRCWWPPVKRRPRPQCTTQAQQTPPLPFPGNGGGKNATWDRGARGITRHFLHSRHMRCKDTYLHAYTCIYMHLHASAYTHAGRGAAL